MDKQQIVSFINENMFGIWFLIGAALVFWMQAGFAMVETGFTRAKNAGNILMKNLMDFCIGTVMFILIGFSLLLGEDVLNAREKQLRQWRGARVAMIFQEPMTALNPTRRIGLQMMDVIRHHQPISRREARAKAIDLLEEMQIPDAVEVMSRYPFELSGGMRQRVMIALAFSCEPQLIIADEPTTALDVTVQLQVLRLLKHKARASGTAVLFISHDMAVVSQLCDSVYVMYAGSVIESGVTADVIHHPRHPYTIGLLQCAPEHGIPRQPLPAIPGTVPNLTHLPDGCAFRDRCYAAGAQCENVPALTACGDNNQRCACWYPQQEVISV